MDDVERAAITRLVYRRLTDPGFRDRLTAKASDGTRPIVVVLPGDSLERLLADVERLGGAANVVLPVLNGVVVIAMAASANSDAIDPGVAQLTSDCTVGLFFARLRIDGDEAAYRFVMERPDHRRDAGSAEMVALTS